MTKAEQLITELDVFSYEIINQYVNKFKQTGEKKTDESITNFVNDVSVTFTDKISRKATELIERSILEVDEPDFLVKITAVNDNAIFKLVKELNEL